MLLFLFYLTEERKIKHTIPLKIFHMKKKEKGRETEIILIHVHIALKGLILCVADPDPVPFDVWDPDLV